jgi:Protein of unknown function (DUF2950)
MNQIKSATKRYAPSFLEMIAALTVGIVVVGWTSIVHAQQSFKTPEEAVEALVRATKSDWPRGVTTVLGPAGADIVSSGDEVADEDVRAKFVAAYEAKHQVTMEGDSKAVLIIGPDDYPLPIPLVRKDAAWQFDAAAGRQEILYRRIGRNELDTIQACLAYVDAQNEYSDKDRTGAGMATYAQRIISRPGKKDGLYWPSSEGGDVSPLGELVAQATDEGYRVNSAGAPFHGYYFKILKRQGANAPGGAMDYVVRGNMIGGFALAAYPADYGNSGVMTFLVNHTGQVFQKDLGPNTARFVKGMTAYNPDQTWSKVSAEMRAQ